MANKRGKSSYKVERLRSLLSLQDQAAFSSFIQFSPPYSSIQAWFAERGHVVSLNGLHRWWRGTQLTGEEIRIVNALATHLDLRDGHRLHCTALKLTIIATSILDAHLNGKLANADPEFLVESQRELFFGTVELAKLSRSGSI